MEQATPGGVGSKNIVRGLPYKEWRGSWEWLGTSDFCELWQAAPQAAEKLCDESGFNLKFTMRDIYLDK